MTGVTTDSSPEPETANRPSPRVVRRNFLAIAWYQISLRVGWIFKTESVIIPAALDSLGASGWMRGWLPVLGRFGQSIPPTIAWAWLGRSRTQKVWLFGSTLVMCGCFAAMALLWTFRPFADKPEYAQLSFLVLYGVFFTATGINQLTLSTLIGRLIPVRRRGLLMLFSNTRGAVASISCAWILLGLWLSRDVAEFHWIFGTAAFCFLAAALCCLLIDDRRSARPVGATPRPRTRQVLSGIWNVWRHDRQFRVVALISAMFGMSMTLFPHYQNLARARLEVGYSDLLPWLIAQNAGVALFSIPAGKLADRWGNRLVLRFILLLLLTAPLSAIWISRWDHGGGVAFTAVYFLLGLTPVTMRILANLSLEFAEPDDQPRYLAAQGIALALPVIATANLMGWILDQYGADWIFGVGATCVGVGWLLTFVLQEPRHGKRTRKTALSNPMPG